MPDYALTLQNLSKRDGKTSVLKDVNLAVRHGEIHALVGPGGSGKSTVLNMVIGAQKPSSGTGKVYHKRIGTIEAREITGYVQAVCHFYPWMSVSEYLVYMGQLSGVPKFEAIHRATEYLRRIDMFSFRDKKPSDLPVGMKTKIGIAQAMMSKPQLLLLDEPVTGLDPIGKTSILQIIRDISRQDQISVLCTAQNWTEIETVADTITFLRDGKTFMSGITEDVRRLYSHGLYILSTSDNDKFIAVLQRISYIKKVTKSHDGSILLITDESDRFLAELPGFVHKLDILLYCLVQQAMSIENIHQVIEADQGV